MLVVMQAHATADQIHAVCTKIESLGYRPHSIPGAERTAIGITGNKGEVEDEASNTAFLYRTVDPIQ